MPGALMALSDTLGSMAWPKIVYKPPVAKDETYAFTHWSCRGAGQTAQEALDAWRQDIEPRLVGAEWVWFRVGPEIDVQMDFATDGLVFVVYSRHTSDLLGRRLTEDEAAKARESPEIWVFSE